MNFRIDAGRALTSGWQGSESSRKKAKKVGKATDPKMRDRLSRRSGVAAAVIVVLSAMTVLTGPTSIADPDPTAPPADSDLLYAFPVITPAPSDWRPKFPFPYDQTRERVTPADITAMAEMCQWFNRYYATLRDQIDRLQFNRIGPDGKDFDYTRGDIQQQVDVVTGNLDRSLDFLTPRVHALTQARNTFGDIYFPIYEGEQFFKLHEQLFNVNNGIRSHQPAWFTGPSVQKAKRHGSDIYRSNVCE